MMYRVVKRAFDIVFAVLFFVIFFPIYITTAIIIKIVSPGSVFYRARRVGLNGQIFTCYKFRSMRIDSGKVRLTTLANDDRVFPFGKFIRKAKIDEMPQVWNILIGQMSVVGPRPEDEANADRIYVGKYREILGSKPGLTSPSSLYDYTHGELYCSEISYSTEFVPKKLELDLFYIHQRSFRYDIKLVIKTAIVVALKICGRKKFSEPKEILKIALRSQESLSSSQFLTKE